MLDADALPHRRFGVAMRRRCRGAVLAARRLRAAQWTGSTPPIAGRNWRPQDCALLDLYSDELKRWTLSAVELLSDTPRVSLHASCPRCGERFAYRRDSTERVRVLALRGSEHGCKCQGRGAFEVRPGFEWLARLIVCTSPLTA